MSQPLIFPVLWMGEAGAYFFIEGPDQMNRTNSLTLKSGNLLYFKFLDSQGFEFIPASVRKIKTLRWSIFLNHDLQIEYTFQPNPRKRELEDLKKELEAGILAGIEFYESAGDPNKFLSQVRAAESFQGLIKLFNIGSFDWEYD